MKTNEEIYELHEEGKIVFHTLKNKIKQFIEAYKVEPDYLTEQQKKEISISLNDFIKKYEKDGRYFYTPQLHALLKRMVVRVEYVLSKQAPKEPTMLMLYGSQLIDALKEMLTYTETYIEQCSHLNEHIENEDDRASLNRDWLTGWPAHYKVTKETEDYIDYKTNTYIIPSEIRIFTKAYRNRKREEYVALQRGSQ